MGFKIFGHENKICPMDLVTGDNGRLASTKIWMHACYAVLTWKVVQMDSISWDIMTAYGSIVGGSFIASKLIGMKYGADAPDPAPVTVNQPSGPINVAGNVKMKKGKGK